MAQTYGQLLIYPVGKISVYRPLNMCAKQPQVITGLVIFKLSCFTRDYPGCSFIVWNQTELTCKLLNTHQNYNNLSHEEKDEVISGWKGCTSK